MNWLLLPLAYLIGSISFAFLAGKLNGVDLRAHGSKNLGATNAGRVLGKKWFWIVFGLDVAKGLLPVLAANWLVAHRGGDATWLPLATAAATVLGHVFTCFHRFRGGKAVATALGVLIGLIPIVAAATAGVWLLAWVVGWAWLKSSKSNAVGPASVAAALAMPLFHLWLADRPWYSPHLPLTVFCLLLASLVIVRHRGNIAKLLTRAPAPSAPHA